MSELSDDDLRIKCAEAAGWVELREQDYDSGYCGRVEDIRQFWQGVNPETGEHEPIPALSLDLCASLRALLTEEEQEEYGHQIWMQCSSEGKKTHGAACFEMANATARHHAEAFLRAKGAL